MHKKSENREREPLIVYLFYEQCPIQMETGTKCMNIYFVLFPIGYIQSSIMLTHTNMIEFGKYGFEYAHSVRFDQEKQVDTCLSVLSFHCSSIQFLLVVRANKISESTYENGQRV